jgi:hypothetical protein
VEIREALCQEYEVDGLVALESTVKEREDMWKKSECGEVKTRNDATLFHYGAANVGGH